MKIASTLLRICLLSVGIFLMGIGCSQKRTLPEELEVVELEVVELEVVELEVVEAAAVEVEIVAEDANDIIECPWCSRQVNVGVVPPSRVTQISEGESPNIFELERLQEAEYSDSTDEQWNLWVTEKENNGYKVLSPAASKTWIEENGISVNIIDNSSVNGGIVIGAPRPEIHINGAIITVDPNQDHRVAVKK